MTSRIAIVGAGEVGAATAFALLLSAVCGEILIVEKNVNKRDAQVRDLANAACSGKGRTRVRCATYKEASTCDIIIITAGSKKAAGHRSFIGETSLQVLYENAGTLRSIINAMQPIRSDAILIIVTNPVDILTTLAIEIAGLPKTQIIGSGTFVDCVRLRGFLSERTKVSPSSIDAYVLGEHGNGQFVAWSAVTVGGVPIDKALPANQLNKREIEDQCKFEGRFIMEAKGCIAYGIGTVVASMCESILFDERCVRMVSFYQPEYNCCISLPVMLGRKGVEKAVSLPLSGEELEKLENAARVVREAAENFEELRTMWG